MSIEVKNITKIYGNQKALNDISFKVEEGEIIGFLGPNGAGKSTLMKILTGYLKASEGVALVNDFNVFSETIDSQRQIGYLPEHNPLYLDMYIKEYLLFNAAIHKIEKQEVDKIIDRVGLRQEAHKKISELSKGYRQRVGLAAALLHNPKVLILDEPTTGLDPISLIRLKELIQSEKAKGKTILITSHIMSFVEEISDEIVFLLEGEIYFKGTIDELKNKTNQPDFEHAIASILIDNHA